jgi:hypothetical protein
MPGYEPFKLEEGGIDDVDATLTNCRFEFDPEYQDGDVLVFKTDLEIDDDDYDEPFTARYSCGQGWTTLDKGKTAEREDGKKKNFNKRGAFGLLLGSVFELEDALEVLQSRYAESEATPQDAGLLDGLKFHMEQKETDYGGDIGKINRLVATSYLGEAGSGSPKASGKKASKPAAEVTDSEPEAAAPAKKKKASADNNGEVPTDVLAQMDALADESETHEEFMEKVFDALDTTPAIEDAMKATDEGSVWQRAVARAE